MISFGFVLLMMAIGGVIGFFADRWGRVIGKKRLSLLGLRPRHTATVITVGAGVLIPLVTILVVSVVSSDVRAWLLQGQKAIREARELQDTVDRQNLIKKGLDSQIRAKGRQVADLDLRLKATEKRVEQFQAKAAEFLLKAQKASARTASVQRQLAQSTTLLKQKREEMRFAKLDLDKRKAELKNLTRDFDTLSKEIRDAYLQNAQLDSNNVKLNEDLVRIRTEVGQLQTDKAAVQQELDDSQQRLNQARQKFAEDIQNMSKQLSDTEQALANARQDLQESKKLYRTNPMIFSMGEELARLTVEPGRSNPEAATMLVTLMRTARQSAEQRGAVGSASEPSAGLWPIMRQGRTISVIEQEEAIAKSLTARTEHFVLVASATVNAFKGESVPLTVMGYRNPIVYAAGRTIAEGRIDGTLSENDILAQISEFVRTKVAERARADNMIPVVGREGGFGTVSSEEILAIVKQIKEANRRVRLRAEAAQETRAADPLKLKLSVR